MDAPKERSIYEDREYRAVCALQKAVEEKRKNVAELEEKVESAQRSAEKLGVAESIGVWGEAVQNVLQAIVDHPRAPVKQDGSRFGVAEVLAAMNISPEAVGFDVDEDEFVPFRTNSA